MNIYDADEWEPKPVPVADIKPFGWKLEALANRQAEMLLAREDKIYRDIMRQYMPPEIFAKVPLDIRKEEIHPDVARWIQDNDWHFQIVPVSHEMFVSNIWTIHRFTCKEIRRGPELIARHYFQFKAG